MKPKKTDDGSQTVMVAKQQESLTAIKDVCNLTKDFHLPQLMAKESILAGIFTRRCPRESGTRFVKSLGAIWHFVMSVFCGGWTWMLKNPCFGKK